jgi:hypothetical protein
LLNCNFPPSPIGGIMAKIHRGLDGAELMLCCHKHRFLGNPVYGDTVNTAVQRAAQKRS